MLRDDELGEAAEKIAAVCRVSIVTTNGVGFKRGACAVLSRQYSGVVTSSGGLVGGP
jgi:hypothetical protein